MPGIHETGSRLITSGLSGLKKQIQKVVNKFSGRSVKEHEPDLNLPQNNDNTGRIRRRSIGKRKVKAAKADTPVAAKKVQENSGKTSLKPGKVAPEKTKSKELPVQNEPLHDMGPSGGATIKNKAKDVLPDMIPDKVLPPPNLFGDREVEKGAMLGKGNFGKVYMVNNTHSDLQPEESPGVLQKKYAVKDQWYESADREDRLEFVNEVRNEVGLQNFDNNSLPILQDGFLYKGNSVHHRAMMEYGGHSLEDLGTIDNKTARGVGRQFLLQLSSLHQQGVIHGDIKPGNILLDQQGRVRLIDFGMAQKEKVSHPDDKLFSGITGTEAYMAPEVLGGKEYSVKADIWSAGVLLYELLTSREAAIYRDVTADSHSDVSEGSSGKAFDQAKEFIRDLEKAPNLPQNQKSLLLSMLEPNPSKRATAEELLNSPFFQNQGDGDESHFELQSQHHLKYRRLALLEKELEDTEALNQNESDDSMEQKIIALKNEVSATGAELKHLQSKMELLDMKAECRTIKAKLEKLKKPVAQSEINKLGEILNKLNEEIRHIDDEVKEREKFMSDYGKVDSNTTKKVEIQLRNFEIQLSPLKAQQADLEEQLHLAENEIQSEKSKKEQEELEFIIPVVERDITLKEFQCQKLGSKAELLLRKHQLTNEAQNQSNSVSPDKSEPLSQALNRLEEEIKAVDIKYDEDVKEVMKAYQNNSPS